MSINIHDTPTRIRLVEELSQWFDSRGLSQPDAMITAASYCCVMLAARATNEADLNTGLGIMIKSMRGESLAALRAKQLHGTPAPTETRQ